jgi:two-component system, NarL family, response regulator DevR
MGEHNVPRQKGRYRYPEIAPNSAVPPRVPSSDSLHPIRVLAADRGEIIRAGIRTLFQGEPDLSIVGEAGTVKEILAQARKLKPDAVLLDSCFRDGSGADACRLLLKTDPKIRIVTMSISDDSSACRAAFEAGAHGYVLKAFKCHELLRAIRIVAGGASYIHSGTISLALRTHRDGPEGMEGPVFRPLSPQERRMMPLLVEGQTNKEIAAELSLSVRTVDTYMANMFHKLRITRRTQAVALYLRDRQTTARAEHLDHESFTSTTHETLSHGQSPRYRQ